MLDLVKALEKGLDRLEGEEWADNKIHVSDLAVALEGDDGKCPKQLWLRLNNAKKQPLTAGQKLMFQQGHNLHKMAVELIGEGLLNDIHDWYLEDCEQPVEIEGITGRYDCKLSNIEETYKHIIVDFKTLRGNAFNYLNEPKASNVLQVQTYMMATDADYGMLLYIDREGQNFARQFTVERNDEAVKRAIKVAKNISNMKEPPPILDPQIRTRENKNSTAIYLKEPWQCQYCSYRDVSCPGAVEEKLRDSGVIGYIKDGEYQPKKEYKDLNIEPLLEVG